MFSAFNDNLFVDSHAGFVKGGGAQGGSLRLLVTSFHHDKPVGWETHSKYNVLLMRMKCDQILSVCLDITTHFVYTWRKGAAATEGKEM